VGKALYSSQASYSSDIVFDTYTLSNKLFTNIRKELRRKGLTI
jgi:hypothetical protein